MSFVGLGAGLPPVAREALGAYHTYELPYVFNLPYATPSINMNCTYSVNETLMAPFVAGGLEDYVVTAAACFRGCGRQAGRNARDRGARPGSFAGT
jgi:hypothetical protein